MNQRSFTDSNRARRALSAAALALVLASVTQAQQMFGAWEDDATGASTELFVSTTGNDVTGDGSPVAPYRSVTRALADAQFLWGDPVIFGPVGGFPGRVTINIAPGLYDAVNGETFPLRIPAHGAALDAWPQTGMVGTGRPVIDATGSGTEAILVDWIGNEPMPASAIQSLEILNATAGIRIQPSLQPGQPAQTAPLAVEVRESFIHDCEFGVWIVTDPALAVMHVIEDNDIGDEGPIMGVGIFEQNDGVSSVLYRSNRVQLSEFGISIESFDNPLGARPRLFSNFVQICEQDVVVQECDSFIVNNTIAFAAAFSAVPVVNGLILFGGIAELHNNILWCPNDPSGAIGDDLLVVGTLVIATTNLEEDLATGFTPDFVGGDLHPGMAPTDLHLLPISAMIGAGTLAQVADPADTILTAAVGGLTFRTDVAVDNDMDGRIFLSTVEPGTLATVDIGGDEFLDVNPAGTPECRIIFPGGPLQDVFGNVISTPDPSSIPTGGTAPLQGTYATNFTLSGPPSAFFTLRIGTGYFDTVNDPNGLANATNGPVFQNLVGFGGNPTLGNLTIDPSLAVLSINGSLSAVGQFPVTFNLGMQTYAPTLETEWWLQMLTLDPATGRIAASNRQRMEFNF